MQAASDIFLGWTKGADTSRHFYWRQLRDMKGSVDTELIRAGRARRVRTGVRLDARTCPRADR